MQSTFSPLEILQIYRSLYNGRIKRHFWGYFSIPVFLKVFDGVFWNIDFFKLSQLRTKFFFCFCTFWTKFCDILKYGNNLKLEIIEYIFRKIIMLNEVNILESPNGPFTPNHIGWPSDGHRIAIGWTFYRMGSVPQFFKRMELIFERFHKWTSIWVFLCTFYFVFIMLCYIFSFVNVALSIVSKSNLHPFCIWCVWMLYSIV